MNVPLESVGRAASPVGHRPGTAAQLLAFLAVGGAAALGFVGLSTLAIGLETGIPDWIVSALCYAAFIVPVYLVHRSYAFRARVPHRVALPRYAAVQLGALVLASALSYVFYAVLNLPTLLAAVLVIALTSGLSFLMLKLWAFAQQG